MTSLRYALLFPGQGAQYPGMGLDFARIYPAARQVFEEADDTLQICLSRLIFEGPQESLTETRHSQLAIYVTSLALLQVLQQLFPLSQPQVCAGLSLGEYTALTAAGYLGRQQGLSLVRHRAQYMHEACSEQAGSMAVVMGLDGEVVTRLVDEANLPHDLWVANLNCPGQVVISGSLLGIKRGTEMAQKAGAKRVLPLEVAGAFHSGLMKSAETRLAPHISGLLLQKGHSRVVMNVPGDFVSGESTMRQNLISQVTQPVRWEAGIRAMMREGVDLLLEVGPGKTLAGMNKRIGVTAPTMSIETVEDLKKCDEFFAGICS